jgi:recombination protein RecT
MSTELMKVDELVLSTRDAFLAVQTDKSLNFNAEAEFAIQILCGNSFALDTARMNPQSVRDAVTNVAAIGISLNPARRQAYLVPRDGKICLDISYMGLLDMAIESGSILWGQAELVYAADQFALNGVDKPPTHVRDPFKTDRGEVIGAYVVVKTRDGDYLTTTMSIGEINDIRNRTKAFQKGKGPWVTDPGEMAKKTVIKRSSKLWPKTARLDNAIHYLNKDNDEGLPEFIESDDPIDQQANLGLSPQAYSKLRKAAGAALELFNVGDEYGAFGELEYVMGDNVLLQAAWTILKPHSALRTSLRKISAEIKDRDAKLAQMTAVTT